MICIGYVGYEAFDIILYVSRTLTKLQYKVLIVDLSNTGALTNAIPHGMGLDSQQEIVHYRNLNYVRRMPFFDELKEYQDGVVIVVYGLNASKVEQLKFTIMNIVVTPVPNLIEKVTEAANQLAGYTGDFSLLVRDIVTLEDITTVKDKMQLSGRVRHTDYLFYEMNDYESALDCQRNKAIRLTKTTSKMKLTIIRQIQNTIPDLKIKRIKQALAAARKGG